MATKPSTFPSIKRGTLFVCLSFLVTIGILKINNAFNLSLYQHHIECSKMESLGAWHFPKTVPDEAYQVVYDFDINEGSSFMKLSFQIDNIDPFQAYQSSQVKDNIICSQSTTLDLESNTVTFIHKRSLAEGDLPQIPFSYTTSATALR